MSEQIVAADDDQVVVPLTQRRVAREDREVCKQAHPSNWSADRAPSRVDRPSA